MTNTETDPTELAERVRRGHPGFTEDKIPYTVMTRLEIPEELLEGIMVTAFDGDYGGCWYWAQPASVPGGWLEVRHRVSDYDPHAEHNDWISVKIVEGSEAELHNEAAEHNPSFTPEPNVLHVTYATLMLGMQRMLDENLAQGHWATKAPMIQQAILDADGGMIDSDLADCIVQQGLFDKQVYS